MSINKRIHLKFVVNGYSEVLFSNQKKEATFRKTEVNFTDMLSNISERERERLYDYLYIKYKNRVRK